jgi:uncharacterized protein YhfF
VINKHQPISIETFWQEYQNSLPPDHPHAGKSIPLAWGFGDSPQLADELGALVFQGIKTATCSLLWEYDTGSEPVPQPGDLSIILDGQGNPLCLIETVEMQIKPFDQVDAPFAYEEGEGDRSLAYWRDAHWRYFWRTCPALGRTPTPAMPLVCERFRLAWMPPLDSDPTDE